MRYPTVFHLLGGKVGKAKIPFLIVGGFAVNYHKATRATLDLDLMMTDESFQKVKPIFEKAGYELAHYQSPFARFKDKENRTLDIDTLFVDPNTFNGILRESVEAEIEGYKFRFPSLRHLIALKLHAVKNNPEGRQFRDLWDVMEMTRRNGVDVRSPDFKELCLKYGTEALYGEILEAQKKWKS